jgi:hypothetical protein
MLESKARYYEQVTSGLAKTGKIFLNLENFFFDFN